MTLIALIPLQCGGPLLEALTPVLYQGGNPVLQNLIRLVAPLVVP